MRLTKRSARSIHGAGVATALLALLLGETAHAAFHLARIDEVMVGYDGDPAVQFVEVRMLSGGQNFTDGVKLGLFDATGTFAGIAHFAHLGGMVGGALVLLRWRRRR